MNIIDTHTHLNDESFKEDLDEVIANAKSVGVKAVINASDTVDSFKVIIDLAKKYPDFCYSAIGVHPSCLTNTNELDEIYRVLNDNGGNIVAIGEIGLDFHYPLTNVEKDLQLIMFEAQMDIAIQKNLPIMIHSRDAHALTYDAVVNKKPKVPVILHCYSGSYELAKRYVASGIDIYFGIGGVSTFKNAKALVETIKGIDISRLLLETDAPYLSPEPFRGRRNDPSKLVQVVNKVAELKDMDVEETARIMYENAKRVFNI